MPVWPQKIAGRSCRGTGLLTVIASWWSAQREARMRFGIRGVLALNTLCAAIVGTGSRDTRVLVWDVETAAVVQTLEGHKYQVWPQGNLAKHQQSIV